MQSSSLFTLRALSIAILGTASASTVMQSHADANTDFGAFRDHQLEARAMQLFGVVQPVKQSSTSSVDGADPLSLITLAKGLEARIVSADEDLGANIDMMTLWPQVNPTHLIVCNEQGTEEPGVQRVQLSDGSVETILTGTRSCDPSHATPWGTVLVGEEREDGSVLEILDPLGTTDVEYDRDAGTFSGDDADNVALRTSLGHLAYEGVAIYPNGVVYYGDENRPFEGTPGGAYFKFVPDLTWDDSDPIENLEDSPLAEGEVYGLRLGKRSGDTDYGQGSNTGLGTWVPIVLTDYESESLREAASALSLSGFYRPEDAAIDQAALAEGQVRFCANNTGNEGSDRNWGETICVSDGNLDEAADPAGENTPSPEVQLFVTGTNELAMMDNIAYQPGRGNWILQEDGDAVEFEVDPHNNDIWACLGDGADIDTLSDGCVRIATLNDLNAETTGGFFDPTGKHYYVSIQHNVTGHGVILEITGWK